MNPVLSADFIYWCYVKMVHGCSMFVIMEIWCSRVSLRIYCFTLQDADLKTDIQAATASFLHMFCFCNKSLQIASNVFHLELSDKNHHYLSSS